MGCRLILIRSMFPSCSFSVNFILLTFYRLFDVFLAFAVARRWPDVASNAVSPGWVATKMGGAGAPGSMKKAWELPAWLATHEREETGSGKYLAAQDGRGVHGKANDVGIQDEFMKICEEISGVKFPA